MDNEIKYKIVENDYDNTDSSFQVDCDSVRDFEQQIKSFLFNLKTDSNILNVGGSYKECKYFLNNSFKVFDLDISQHILDGIAKNHQIECQKGNILNFKYNKKFDGIWACRSLIHITPLDIETTLQNIHLLLKKNGVFSSVFLTSDKDSIKEEFIPETSTKKENIIIYRVIYYHKDIINKIQKAGFKIAKQEIIPRNKEGETSLYIEAFKL